MLFTRFISYFAVLPLALGGLAPLIPASSETQVVKRNMTTAIEMLTTLKASTDSVLPKIKDAAESANMTNATVVPLINNPFAAIQI
ncbi:hypothetical protein ACEPAH_5347 [Sanghuangporus vaninii]